jgi:hypothetical protein
MGLPKVGQVKMIVLVTGARPQPLSPAALLVPSNSKQPAKMMV